MNRCTEHRAPLPPPTPWALHMSWHDLLFIHWPVPVESLRRLVPGPLDIDTFAGRAWIAVVPFRMTNVRPRGLPTLPWLSRFAELNVRTYVRPGGPDHGTGQGGVYFFSLDAANPVAVTAARRFFHLPYFRARMSNRHDDGWVRYRSDRTHRGAAPATFEGRYRPIGEPYLAAPGSLDAFLTERYCLYTLDRHGRLMQGNIHHDPWPLQPAEAHIATNTMLEPLGLEVPATAPLLHFAKRLGVTADRLFKVC